MKVRAENGQDLAQQNPEPADRAAEVVADGGEDGVIGVAAPEPEIVAAHAVLGFEMADDGLDGGPAAEFALDLRRHPSLLPGDEDPELVNGRRIVAAVGSAFTWVTDWPPLQCLRVVATLTLTPNS
ncbi:hypothetical protein SAMN05443247_04553 [Bradyrhizobium erythrophlei]|nr:hypothetical protein SAMN05443247_04553 [Bradyrhizobium erythrophlei]